MTTNLFRINARKIIEELRDEGHIELSLRLSRELAQYQCPICGQSDKVGFAMKKDTEEGATRSCYFCIPCSGKAFQECYEKEER